MNECIHALQIRLHQIECVKCLHYKNLCEDNENCYYKKLQRIEEYCKLKKCSYDGEADNCMKKEILKIISAGETDDNYTSMYDVITDESEV